MAGHVIYKTLMENSSFEVVDIARGERFHKPRYQLDVSDFSALKKLLEAEMPSVVINCIGVLNKDAEDHPDKAILLNSYLPHFLARSGNELGFKLIHISTDCVFSGQVGNYSELSSKDGQGYYAQTKALGEVTYSNHLTLRTSIIGPELKSSGIGLFHWFMKQKGNIKGYRKAYWTGVTTIELAKAIEEAINQNIHGLHHLVNDKKINKFELTSLMKRVFKKDDVIIEPFDEYKVDKSLIKTNKDFTYQVPSYEVMLREMKSWIDEHSEFYKYSS